MMAFAITGTAQALNADDDLVDLINPLIGTDGYDPTEYGGTMPLVTVPYGMTNWVAMTRANKISSNSYHYRDRSISGFIGTHQPAIWMGDYGSMAVMPGTGAVMIDQGQRAMYFGHAAEVATPNYYRVEMTEEDPEPRWRDIDVVTGNTDTITDRTVAPVRTRFVRISIAKAQQAPSEWPRTAVRLYGLELYDSAGRIDLEHGVSVTTSWCAKPDEQAENILRASAPAKWSVIQPSAWLAIDLGAEHVLSRWVVRHAGAGGESDTLNSRDFSLQIPDPTPRPVVDASAIVAEMTATCSCSLMRFSYVRATQPHLVIDASFASDPAVGGITIDAAHQEVTGWNKDRHSAYLGPKLVNFSGYFVLQVDTPIISSGVSAAQGFKEGEQNGVADALSAAVRFPVGTSQVLVRIGTSFISIDQARENLKREIPDWNFDAIKQVGHQAWNDQLSRVQVEGGSADERIVFYSSLYHAHTYPRTFSEYGRYYSAFDDKVHAGVSYNDYSLWDTFRGLHPLLTLIAPERVGDMITSLLQMYQEGGWLPKWPNPSYTGIMIGSPADAVIADAWVKGLHTFDLKLAYEACYKGAMVPQVGDEHNRWPDRQANGQYPETRGGLTWYKRNGWVAFDKTAEAGSRTLEFAFEDFCIAQLAKALGKNDDCAMFLERSQNFRKLWHDGFMTSRNLDGSWVPELGFTEGDKWSYTFCAMQDIPGLIGLMGGNEPFAAKLDQNFHDGHYHHDNEPGHHYAYLYDYCGQPWKTQKQVREIMKLNYRNVPEGYCGNDDCGQMSAWHVLSSLGFYSVTPGTDLYALGSPLWSKATIHIGPPYAPATFVIIANHQSAENVYVQAVRLNGKALTTSFIHHGDIIRGGQLEFDMGPTPNEHWGN